VFGHPLNSGEEISSSPMEQAASSDFSGCSMLSSTARQGYGIFQGLLLTVESLKNDTKFLAL
jgi:hypothetical protein